MDLQQLCLLPWLYIGCTALCPSPDVSPRLYLCIPLVRFPSILPSSFVFMRSLYCLMWPQCNDRQFVLGHTDVIAHERVDNLPGKASKIVTKDQPLDGATSWTHLQNRRKDNFHQNEKRHLWSASHCSTTSMTRKQQHTQPAHREAVTN